MVQGPELPEKASPSCQANHEQDCSFRRSRPSQHVTDKLCSPMRQVRLYHLYHLPDSIRGIWHLMGWVSLYQGKQGLLTNIECDSG